MFDAIQKESLSHLRLLEEIDAQYDAIQEEKGDLPQQIAVLTKTMENLRQTLLSEQKNSQTLRDLVDQVRKNVKELEGRVEFQQEALQKAKDDASYEEISEELEITKLDIKLLRRKIPENLQKIRKAEATMDEVKKSIFIKENALRSHQEKLKEITQVHGEAQEKLSQERKKMAEKMDPILYAYYERVRSVKERGAVKIIDNACQGCFLVVPAQKQLDVSLEKSVYTCENCGRIFMGVIRPVVEVKKKKIRPRASRA